MYGIIDTATELVAVEGEDCWNCSLPIYEIAPNVEKGTATLSEKEESLSYGQTYFDGSWARDKFCTQLSNCVDLDFFYINSQDGMPDDIDAIIGFARPDKDIMLAPKKTPKDHDYYLKAISESA